MQIWCADEGITFECRAPYTEEQNGGAERSGRTLMERSRAMQLEASLPPSLGLGVGNQGSLPQSRDDYIIILV